MRLLASAFVAYLSLYVLIDQRESIKRVLPIRAFQRPWKRMTRLAARACKTHRAEPNGATAPNDLGDRQSAVTQPRAYLRLTLLRLAKYLLC